MSDARTQIERLRALRARPERDLSITGIVRSTADHAGRANRKLGGLIDLWEQLVPQAIAKRTVITALRGGVAHVNVDSAATGYELDRLLRDGLLAELRSRYPGTIARIKVKQGEVETTDETSKRPSVQTSK